MFNLESSLRQLSLDEGDDARQIQQNPNYDIVEVELIVDTDKMVGS